MPFNSRNEGSQCVSMTMTRRAISGRMSYDATHENEGSNACVSMTRRAISGRFYSPEYKKGDWLLGKRRGRRCLP